jgi:hypothetical protein
VLVLVKLQAAPATQEGIAKLAFGAVLPGGVVLP